MCRIAPSRVVGWLRDWVLLVMGRMERAASARCRDKGARGRVVLSSIRGCHELPHGGPAWCAHDEPNSQVALCVGSRFAPSRVVGRVLVVMGPCGARNKRETPR